MNRIKLILVPIILMVLVGAAPAAASHDITRRIRLLTGWINRPAESFGARQTTFWFLNRPGQGCAPRESGSGRQIIEFWEPQHRLTLLHFHGSTVTPATVPVEARVRRYGTVTIHIDQLPANCYGDRGRPKGPAVSGQPDPKWNGGSEYTSRDWRASGTTAPVGISPFPAPGGGGGQSFCGTVRGTMNLHFALRRGRLHMTGEFLDLGGRVLFQCPFFAGGIPPLNEYLLRLLPIDLPIDGDLFDRSRAWMGVNSTWEPGRKYGSAVSLQPPLQATYPGNPHGSTVLDAAMELQVWPPLAPH